MPTFLVIKNSKVSENVRGANPAALRSAVSKAASDAKNAAPKQPAAFQSKGQTLGSGSGQTVGGGRTTGGGIGGLNAMGLSNFGGLPDVVVRFVALYFTSLLSFDAMAAAEASSFAIRQRR